MKHARILRRLRLVCLLPCLPLLLFGCRTQPGDSTADASGRTGGESGVTTGLDASNMSPSGDGSTASATTGTTLPPLPADAFSGVSTADVRDFGAVGDGAADDTAAVQAAVDRVSADGGGYVYLPPGTYRLNAVCLRRGVCLYSERTWNPEDAGSCGETVLVPLDGSVRSVIALPEEENASLRNLCIDGQGLGTAVAGVASTVTDGVTGTSVRIENVCIRNCSGTGLDLSRHAIASVRGCRITGCSTGVRVVGWDQFFCDNVIAGNRGDGVVASGGTAMSFCYNRVGWNDGCGLRFEGYGRVSVTGNTFDSNAGPGVYCSGSTNMALYANLLVRNGWSPRAGLTNGRCQISVNASSGINITENVLRAGADARTGGAEPDYGVIGDCMNTCVIRDNVWEKAGTRGRILTDETQNLQCDIQS